MKYGVWCSSVLGYIVEGWVSEEGGNGRLYRGTYSEEDAEKVARSMGAADSHSAFFASPFDRVNDDEFRAEREAHRERVRERLRRRLR